MLKMFSTQLTGLFNRLMEKQEFQIEDGARLLAQAAAGDGSILLFTTDEMNAVSAEALEGQEPLHSASRFTSIDDVTEADRVLIVSRFADDVEALEIAKVLKERNFFFAAVSTVRENSEEPNLSTLADVHIDLGLKRGLLPSETGERFGYPSAMGALFVYYGIKFTIDEIVAEYE